MSESSTRADGAASPAYDSFWERTVKGWHWLFGGLALIVGAILLLDRAPWWSIAALAGLGMWYAVVGAPALERDENTWRAALYLAVAYPLLGVVVLGSSAGFFLLLALFPQTFAVLALRRAILACTALVATFTLLLMAKNGWTREAAIEAIVQGLVNLAFAVLLGVWITGIIRESERRAELIAELEATRAELAAAHHLAGVQAERERLASEIHDTLAQGFTSILMLAQAGTAALERDPAGARERLAMIERAARENLAEARSVVAALSPAELQRSSLPEAVGRLVNRFGTEMGIRATLEVTDPKPLPANSEVVLLRAAQEALANVRKHAHASEVRVRLDYRAGGAALEVADNGCGLGYAEAEASARTGVSAAAPAGFGLRSMRARVHQVGGVVHVCGSAGGGTTVRIQVP